ncbi:MAG: hypothetical protein V1863_02025 [Candidatus Omnitrophota bacterium]
MAQPKKAKAEDLDFQMAFYEAILKDNPDFVDALMALGEIYTKKGFYAKGLEVDKKLLRLRPENPIVHYNLACSLSLLGDVLSSFKAIKSAVSLGYDDFGFMERDPDLTNLRRSRRFEELMKELNARQK